MSALTPVAVAYGDGIGPEIMAATLKILLAAQAPIDPQVIEVGEKVYRQGFTGGISDEAWEVMTNPCIIKITHYNATRGRL